MAIRLAGQVFDRMAKLVGFVGADKFWSDLNPEFKAKYADICRRSPSEVFFELQKWEDSEEIQVALEEYREELEIEGGDPSNIATDY
jgi:hypothetical protein